MFDFHLLRSFPRPKWSFVFCLLTFGCLAGWYLTVLQSEEITAKNLDGALYEFLRDEHTEHAKHPQILIAGSSLSGMGFHIESIKKRAKMPAANISLNGSCPEDALDILECYPHETQYAKILFLELAPERISSEQRKIRKQFFDGKRGTTNPEILLTFLKRSSMSEFVKSCRLSKRFPSERVGAFFEHHWDDPKYRKKSASKKIREPLTKQASFARENEKTPNPKPAPLMVKVAKKGKNVYYESQIDAVYRLLEVCQARNIFLVVCVTPQWYGQLNFTQNDIKGPTEDRYLSLLQDINTRPDCTVIIARDFEEITGEVGTDENHLFDYGHMTREGAIVYTNWLLDKLMEEPKVGARFPAMLPMTSETPRMAEEEQPALR